MTKQEIKAALGALRLGAKHADANFVEIPEGPMVSLMWADGGFRVRLLFPSGHLFDRVFDRSACVTKGRSPWMRDNVWRLSPEMVEKLATAISKTRKATLLRATR